MLKLPGSTAQFLARYWQKAPLFLPQAVERMRPSVTRNEIAWLATLDDVESRLIFTDRTSDRVRYRAESGPFDEDYLADLPRRDWTLLVHDVEKHIPALRKLFALVPFIPDWRIDDLMISFAAPGGGVGPHRDNYDVFLCQGIGVREWRVTTQDVDDDPAASDDLALLREFGGGDIYSAREGDVLYLPPGVAHWGTAERACTTYSIGMRAPQLSDLDSTLPDDTGRNPFYADPDLNPKEAQPGYISAEALARAAELVGVPTGDTDELAISLGRAATQTKDWITPEFASDDEANHVLATAGNRLSLVVHGMARLAFDDRRIFVNGNCRELPEGLRNIVAEICEKRRIKAGSTLGRAESDLLRWMLKSGAFELTGNL